MALDCITDESIKSSTCEKLLGIEIDKKLYFQIHVKSLCKKENDKWRALAINVSHEKRSSS